MSSGRLDPGTVIGGDFEVIRVLGEGGMGIVYEARQRSTGALRALKTMQAREDADQLRDRFEQEARIASRIASDHIVQVLAAGIDEKTGIPWIAMELLKGEELADRLLRGPLPLAEARPVLAQLFHAVAAAHAESVVHRDLKPNNIFLARSKTVGSGASVKVLDFGIAKLLNAGKATTAAVGTPLWMAPEQMARRATVTAATDVWALGLITFEMLVGWPYWIAAQDEEATPHHLLQEIAIEELVPASHRAELLGGALPDGFDAWFAKCVVRDAAARYADAGQAWEALERVLEAAVDAPPPRRASEPPQRPLAHATTEVVSAKGPVRPAPAAPPPPVAEPAPAAAVEPAPAATAAAPAATGGNFSRTAPQDPVEEPPAARGGLPRGAAWVGAAALTAMVVYGVTRGDAPTAAVKPPSPSVALVVATVAPAASSAAPAPSQAAPSGPGVAAVVDGVRIPGAKARMGSKDGAADEQPVISIVVASFYIDRTEVTTRAYASCVAAGVCTAAGTGGYCNAGTNRDDHPINCVSWAQARSYCHWVDKRLPTEMEWELAARDGASRKYAWGDAKLRGQACWNRPDEGTCPVGAFAAGATPEGVLDLTGNVWEWTASAYCPYDVPSCNSEWRVARGGAWSTVEPALLRAAARNQGDPEGRVASIGFRCARAR